MNITFRKPSFTLHDSGNNKSRRTGGFLKDNGINFTILPMRGYGPILTVDGCGYDYHIIRGLPEIRRFVDSYLNVRDSALSDISDLVNE